jgi:hypothetical protein
MSLYNDDRHIFVACIVAQLMLPVQLMRIAYFVIVVAAC